MPSALTPQQQQQLAVAAHAFQAGRYDEAVELTKAILSADPNCGLASKLLGSALLKQGDLLGAVDALRRATILMPDDPQTWTNFGNALVEMQQVDEGVAAHQRALALQPGNLNAHYNLGCAYLQQAEHALALEQFWLAYELAPQDGDLARLCRELLVELKAPDLQQAFCRLNLQHIPDDCGALAMLGAVLMNDDAADLHEAEALLQRALSIDSEQATVWSNLCVLLSRAGRVAEAIQAGHRGIELAPEWALGLNNLGVALRQQGQWPEAQTCFLRALELDSEGADAWYNLACVCIDLGLHEAARAAAIEAVQRKPDAAWLMQAAHACRQMLDWDAAELIESALLSQLQEGGWEQSQISPFAFLTLPFSSAADQLTIARHFAQQFSGRAELPDLTNRQPRSLSAPLRVGLLSADFRDHATAHLLTGVLECLDPRRIQLFAYDYSPQAPEDDLYLQRLQKVITAWRDIRVLSDFEAARQMQLDGLDVVIDLKGWTQGYRGGILAYRPAPVQMQWLGYPGTMGADWIDYIIADEVVIPPGADTFYAEKVLRLPGCYQPNDRQRVIGPTPSRADLGLPEHAVVLAAFHQHYKITREVFSVWLDSLRVNPNAVLWLLEAPAAAKATLEQAAAQAGVSVERLIWAPRLSQIDHLGRLRQADLALDTYPVNAHTTASDALWARVPHLAVCGESFVSRVSASIVTAAGLNDLVSPSLEEHASLLKALVSNPQQLNALKLRAGETVRQSALFDTPAFATALEKMLWEVVRDRCS